MAEVNNDFMEFLSKNPEALSKFVDVVKAFRGSVTTGDAQGRARGPGNWVAGNKYELVTKGITDEELDAAHKEYAEGVAKEKLMQYIKGFIAGVMLFKGG